jgi:hypothetical protein
MVLKDFRFLQIVGRLWGNIQHHFVVYTSGCASYSEE